MNSSWVQLEEVLLPEFRTHENDRPLMNRQT